MNIDRHLAPFIVYSGDPVLSALSKITANQARIVFCLSEHGILEGSLTDGDFRRWIAGSPEADLTAAAIEVANRSPISAGLSDSAASIAALFGQGIDRIPLTDERGHLVAIAVNEADVLRIDDHVIGSGSPAFVIAEIGINHNGSVELARDLVDVAAAAEVDCVKFQMRHLDALYRRADGSAAGEDLGPQYTLDLLNKFSLTNDELFSVFDYARRKHLSVMCTPWDHPSVDALRAYGIAAYKIASADLTNHELLRYVLGAARPLVLSTGMSSEAEITQSAGLLQQHGGAFALLHCQSTYPAPFKDINLHYLPHLAQIGGCPVGYSGHERGWHIPLAAVALGASIIEKHITVDRSMEGNDHKVSLLPDELSLMVRQIRELEEAMGTKRPRAVSTGEMMNRVNLAKSLVATRDIDAGELITEADVDIRSPGRGLQPNAREQLIGRTIRRSLHAGDFFYPTDLSDEVARGRRYHFLRPWGLPVRYHDYATLLADTTPDFLEFHFSYQDLDVDHRKVFADLDGQLPMGLACHSPDLFSGDFLLNLASEDDDHWWRSISELQRVIDLTRSLTQYFTMPSAASEPVVIASLGGFTTDAHLPTDRLEAMYQRVTSGLEQLDDSGVRLCAQTLPPFPWYMGGQLYCNLFVRAQDTAAWAARTGRQLTFDVSHSQLSANWEGKPFAEYVELLAPHTGHLHLVDAVGVDGEGVQVGEGDLDWAMLATGLRKWAPQVGFIPEIWQGHVNNGQGFWTALDRLEEWFG